MESQILLEEDPLIVRIYEKPELRDAIAWLVVIVFMAIILGLLVILTRPDQVIFAVSVVFVISLPFFINRFIIQSGSIGGESFKIQRSGNEIIYRSREFSIDTIEFELEIRELSHQKMFQLFMSTPGAEIKLRSDFAENKEKSVTYNLVKHMKEHLGIEYSKLSYE